MRMDDSTDGRIGNGWMGGWMDGLIDGRIYIFISWLPGFARFPYHAPIPCHMRLLIIVIT